MANIRTRLIRVAIITAMIGSAFFAVLVLSPREPTYEGQPFSYWVDHLPLTQTMTTSDGRTFIAILPLPVFNQPPNRNTFFGRQDPKEIETATKAVAALGTNCLQTLVTRLAAREMPLKNTLRTWAVKLRLLEPSYHSVACQRSQALTAIMQLGWQARPIVPELTILSRHSDTNISAAAKFALDQIGGSNRMPY